jgi:hypothetical protein
MPKRREHEAYDLDHRVKEWMIEADAALAMGQSF